MNKKRCGFEINGLKKKKKNIKNLKVQKRPNPCVY